MSLPALRPTSFLCSKTGETEWSTSGRLSTGIHQGDPQSVLQLQCDRVRRGNALTGERLPSPSSHPRSPQDLWAPALHSGPLGDVAHRGQAASARAGLAGAPAAASREGPPERGTAFPTEAEATPSTRFGELWASRCLLSTGDTAADRSSAPDQREEHTRQQQRSLTLDNRTETGPGTWERRPVGREGRRHTHPGQL